MVDLFPPAALEDVTVEAKLRELKRELAMRERVYPQLVERSKLSALAAHRQILILKAIIADYEYGGPGQHGDHLRDRNDRAVEG